MNWDPRTLAALGAILGGAVVTYGYRIGGLLLSDRLPTEGPIKRFMDSLPGAILLALIAPDIVKSGPWGWGAAAATVFFAYKTHNVFIAMVIGMGVVALHRNFL